MNTVERHTLPGRDYRDPKIYELERQQIFLRSWFCAGRAEQAPEPEATGSPSMSSARASWCCAVTMARSSASTTSAATAEPDSGRTIRATTRAPSMSRTTPGATT